LKVVPAGLSELARRIHSEATFSASTGALGMKITIRQASTSIALLLTLVAGADAADQSLSAHAAYRLSAEGFVYPGQVVPGANTRASVAGMMPTRALEHADSGKRLIDGAIDSSGSVITPWFWSGQDKRIVVDMALAGPSKVATVRVTVPPEADARPASWMLQALDGRGGWRTLGQATIADNADRTVAIDAGAVECDAVRVVVRGGRPRLGIAEIEVLGEGPTKSDHVGLVRSPIPAAPRWTPPGGDVRRLALAEKAVRLDATPAVRSSAAVLVDRKPGTAVVVEKGDGNSASLRVDIDLPGTFIIDAVNVVMPGGQGVTAGHANDFVAAVRSGTAGTVWYDVGRVENPYGCLDKAPPRYVVPLVCEPGTLRGGGVRVVAFLSGLGGLTSRLAVSEIEVWGRPVEDDAEAAAPRLRLDPLRWPEAQAGDPPAGLEWLTAREIRAAWVGGSLLAPAGNDGGTKADVLHRAGFDVVTVGLAPTKANRKDPAAGLKQSLPPALAAARQADLKLFFRWQYGSNHTPPYRHYVSPAGIAAKRSCCPLDTKYIQQHIGRWAEAVARGGADGLLIDLEMYESDQTQYPGPCVCNACFDDYLDRFCSDGRAVQKAVPAAARGRWLGVNDATGHYREHQAHRVAELYKRFADRCRAAKPDFLFAVAPELEFLPGIERGLGTSRLPCLVFSEHEYERGVDDKAVANVARVRKENIPALYLAGAWLARQTPEAVERNAIRATRECDGWWLWDADAVLAHPAAGDAAAFDPMRGRAAGTAADDYLGRLSRIPRR
jgi:hypothetical protein